MSQNVDDMHRERPEAHAQGTYQEFLTLAATELGLDKEPSERAIVAVMCALEALLPFDEIKDLRRQLPSSLHDVLGRCDHASPERPHGRTREELVRLVSDELKLEPTRAEEQIRAVFRVLAQTVSRDGIKHVTHMLPAQVRAMWPA